MGAPAPRRYPPLVSLDFRFHAERTPNPNSIKWVLGENVAPPGVAADFPEPVGASVSPLAVRLFAVSGVTRVFFAGNFVTVTKRDEAEWPDLAQPLVDALKEFAASGEDSLGPDFVAPETAGEGDVVFVGYRDGVVEVQLQGSCVGCPSSTATLRFGIEARLREAIPEVERVVSI